MVIIVKKIFVLNKSNTPKKTEKETWTNNFVYAIGGIGDNLTILNE